MYKPSVHTRFNIMWKSFNANYPLFHGYYMQTLSIMVLKKYLCKTRSQKRTRISNVWNILTLCYLVIIRICFFSIRKIKRAILLH